MKQLKFEFKIANLENQEKFPLKSSFLIDIDDVADKSNVKKKARGIIMTNTKFYANAIEYALFVSVFIPLENFFENYFQHRYRNAKLIVSNREESYEEIVKIRTEYFSKTHFENSSYFEAPEFNDSLFELKFKLINTGADKVEFFDNTIGKLGADGTLTVIIDFEDKENFNALNEEED